MADSDDERPSRPERPYAKYSLWDWLKIINTAHAMWELDDIENPGRPAERRSDPPPVPGENRPGAVLGRTLQITLFFAVPCALLLWISAQLLPAQARAGFLLLMGGSFVSIFLVVIIPIAVRDLRAGASEARKPVSPADRDSEGSVSEREEPPN